MRKFTLFILVLSGLFVSANAQTPADSVLFTEQSFFEFSGLELSYYSRFAPNDSRYAYSACGPSGLRVFDLANASSPQLIGSFPRSFFGGLQPDNLEAVGNLLYVCLGAHQGLPSISGMAIMDISAPAQPMLISQWDSTAFTHGTAVVQVEGNYAYLGGMEDGLHILDISNPNSIQFVSNIVPDTNWNPLPTLDPNARGMSIRNDTVFLAYDSGGLRLIDVSNKSQPIEVYKYLNSDLTSMAGPAYNHVIIHGTKAYLSLDYCGFEIVDFGTPDTLISLSWTNTWGCFGWNWNGRDGHSNELVWLDPGRILIASAAKTDLLALDVSNPAQPQIAGQFGVVADSSAVWGVALDPTGEKAILSYVDNTFWPPYYSNRGGIAIVEIDQISTSISPAHPNSLAVDVFPNPIGNSFSIRAEEPILDLVIRVYDLSGKLILKQQKDRLDQSGFEVVSQNWNPGLYLLEIHSSKGIAHQKLVKTE